MKQTVDWGAFWEQDRLDFHQGQVNTHLAQLLPQFQLDPGDQGIMSGPPFSLPESALRLEPIR